MVNFKFAIEYLAKEKITCQTSNIAKEHGMVSGSAI